MTNGNPEDPLPKGEFWEWVHKTCEPRFTKIEDLIRNGIQRDISFIKGTLRVIIPLLVAILALIITLVGLLIHITMVE